MLPGEPQSSIGHARPQGSVAGDPLHRLNDRIGVVDSHRGAGRDGVG